MRLFEWPAEFPLVDFQRDLFGRCAEAHEIADEAERSLEAWR